MKKLVLITAITTAASISQFAHSADYSVSSNVSNIQLWNGFAEFVGTVTEPVVISGTAQDTNDDNVLDSTSLTFDGQYVFDAAGVDVQVTFAMTDGAMSADGTTFTGGTIVVFTDDHTGAGFTHFDTVNVSVDNVAMLAGTGTGAAVPGVQNTEGLNVAIGTTTLPGEWGGVFGTGGFDSGIARVDLLGNTAGLYLSGTITVAPVPVPAAAWLFGSALIGLAGFRQHRK